MGYGDYLRDLLRPLGIYDLRSGSLSGSELDALGGALDAVSRQLDLAEQEIILSTAEDEGLSRREALFANAPVNTSPELRRRAIRALMGINGGSFTRLAVNDAIQGCGINAIVQEKDRFGYVQVSFPGVIGVPEGFERIRKIILDIIPCHLETEFFFRYLTWAECESHGYTWAYVHQQGYTWREFEMAVQDRK